MNLPRLTGTDARDGVTLAVYAPFGTDAVLSHYPDGNSLQLSQHPLMHALLKVASEGVHAVALVDLVDDDTYLVEIPAHRPSDLRVVSRWKQDMSSPETLSGFLRHAHGLHPNSAVVLALEGHGAGFLPDIDTSQLTAHNITDGGKFEWHIGDSSSSPVLPEGSPVLPEGSPVLPEGSPVLPVKHVPMSTWGLGAALKSALAAGVPKLACIHFNNCFNMSVEVLHTVAPYAECATGYANYNFFTAGEAYPAVFGKLKAAGSATPLQLADWFADANHQKLTSAGHQPTVGCVVELSRMHSVAECLDDLADALLAALRTTAGVTRASIVEKIKRSIVRAQQFDADGNFLLETPDELTDVCSFAHELQKEDFGSFKVLQTAAALQEVLAGIKRYGDKGSPWMAPNRLWDFSQKTLAMNILLPDPLRIGLWDWRSPYYLDVNPDPSKPAVQPHIIEFLKVTDWVDFIIEYHKDVPFVGLLPAKIPEFPVFNPRYVPPPPRGDGDPCGEGDGDKDDRRRA